MAMVIAMKKKILDPNNNLSTTPLFMGKSEQLPTHHYPTSSYVENSWTSVDTVFMRDLDLNQCNWIHYYKNMQGASMRTIYQWWALFQVCKSVSTRPYEGFHGPRVNDMYSENESALPFGLIYHFRLCNEAIITEIILLKDIPTYALLLAPNLPCAPPQKK